MCFHEIEIKVKVKIEVEVKDEVEVGLIVNRSFFLSEKILNSFKILTQ